MALPKVISIYRSLASKERDRFGLFVRSPFHNTRNKIVVLMEHIEHITSTLSDEQELDIVWDKKAAHQKVFTGKKYNELQLNNLLSDLYQLLEKFLAWQTFEKNEEQQNVMVIENLMETSVMDNAGKLIKQQTLQKNKDAIAGFKLHQLADQYYFQRSRKGDNAYLLKGQETLDIFYLSNQLRIWCELLSRSNILALQYDAYKFHRFIDYLENNLQQYGEQPTISIYYPILLWLKDQHNDAWYLGFREKLFLHIGEFPEQEAKDIVAYVQNYCVKRINSAAMASQSYEPSSSPISFTDTPMVLPPRLATRRTRYPKSFATTVSWRTMFATTASAIHCSPSEYPNSSLIRTSPGRGSPDSSQHPPQPRQPDRKCCSHG